ncbi:MAG TPA: cohesin domain-containing protein [bacterium]|nr:cohesin domain-containing protein [bacterium]HPG46502.1 cohesin domain-containing protein [bacterium]HPM98441.1 cohesin domain-containing protein [bacterium]
MQKHLLISACLFLTTLACQSLAPTEPHGGDVITVQTALDLTAAGLSTTGLSRLALEVSASDMDTVRTDLTLSDGYARASLKVPAGKNRTFTALGYRQSDLVLRGSTTKDLQKGKEVKVEIEFDYLLPTVILSPPRLTVAADSQFTLYLAARQMQKLAAFGARLTFDPTRLRVEELGRENAFLTSQGGSITQMQFSRNNTLGQVDVVLGVFPAAKAVSGTGNIARVVFKALQNGPTSIELHLDKNTHADLGLYDDQAHVIEVLALSCAVTVTSAP